MKTMLLLFASVAATPAAAQSFQDLDKLETRLTTALDAGIGQPGGPVAPIDRRMKLVACPAPVAIDPPALGAVAIRCAPLGWRIRVPLMTLGGGRGSAGLSSGAQPLVRRGDPVELIAASRSFSVSVAGVAQEDGAQGARIRVKTDPKNPPMFAQVIDAGRVALPGFN